MIYLCWQAIKPFEKKHYERLVALTFTPEIFRYRAEDIRKSRSEHDATIQRLNQIVFDLEKVWEDEKHTAFVGKYRSMEATFRNFSEMLEGYAQLMDNAATQLQTYEGLTRLRMQKF